MSLDSARADTAKAEAQLAEKLLTIGERHKADHDVYHLTRTLAKLAQSHAAELRGNDDEPTDSGGPLRAVREKASELMGSREAAGMLLLRDLKQLHLAASEASICWTILGQGAQAQRDQELLATVTRCHDETLRILRWTTTRIKQTAPQALSS
jgi:hypothetical protein